MRGFRVRATDSNFGATTQISDAFQTGVENLSDMVDRYVALRFMVSQRLALPYTSSMLSNRRRIYRVIDSP
jgi:hypothetical protein